MSFSDSTAAPDYENAFLVTAGRSFRLSATAGQSVTIPTSRQCAAGVRLAGVKCDRRRWRGSVWIVVPASLRDRAIAAEAASKVDRTLLLNIIAA